MDVEPTTSSLFTVWRRMVCVCCVMLLWLQAALGQELVKPRGNEEEAQATKGPAALTDGRRFGAHVAARRPNVLSKITEAAHGAAGEPQAKRLSTKKIFVKAMRRALNGGLPGAAAGAVQVVTLMWLRTVVNYQSRYGTSLAEALAALYKQGGVRRFYRGVSFAILQNPLSRFGLTAANEAAAVLMENLPPWVPVAAATWAASLMAGLWRLFLTPLDTCKTVLQVEGLGGFAALLAKMRRGDLACLYRGAAAAAAATAVGHWPWYQTYVSLNRRIHVPASLGLRLLRNAVIGLLASVASDLCSNSIRVLKTTKQAGAPYDGDMSYWDAARLVMADDGWRGLFGRGLTTRILANGIQSMLFTIVWRYLAEGVFAPAHLDGSAAASEAATVTAVSVGSTAAAVAPAVGVGVAEPTAAAVGTAEWDHAGGGALAAEPGGEGKTTAQDAAVPTEMSADEVSNREEEEAAAAQWLRKQQ
ncbi:unnamed protein product [Phaeothamnion confervicola]